MASSSGVSGSGSVLPAAPDDEERNPQVTGRRRSSTASGGDLGRGSEPTVCAWRTRQFYDQECSRYFDCPSHTIERRLSMDENLEPPHDESAPRVDHSLIEDELYSSEAEQDTGTGRARNTGVETDLASLSLGIESSSMSHDAVIGTARGEELGARRETLSQEQTLPASSGNEHSLVAFDQLHVSIPRAPPVDIAGVAHAERPEHIEPRDGAISPRSRRSSRTPASMPLSRHVDGGLEQPASPLSPRRPHPATARDSPDFVLSRWQPDAEATYCPICYTQFSIFVRKHHCRKCGRVVCNSCSPHRIIIPHQYIVRPPGSEIPAPRNLLMDNLGAGYFDSNGISGGERVRLCNPCVPDPNIAPPQSSTASTPAPAPHHHYGTHHRARSSIGDAYGAAIPPSNRYGMVFQLSQSHDPFRPYTPRSRSSSTMHPVHHGHGSSGSSSSRSRGSTGSYYSTLDPFAAGSSSRYAQRYTPNRDPGSSSRQRNLPPTPQIAEDDECPICHRELPSRSLPDFEAARESHITTCIQSHSSYGSPRRGGATAGIESTQAAPRRTGMYSYSATEKDCIDDAECTICLEEFTAGVAMARLECLCRFHRSCISAWFVNHPGRCPVHQHDGFGY